MKSVIALFLAVVQPPYFLNSLVGGGGWGRCLAWQRTVDGTTVKMFTFSYNRAIPAIGKCEYIHGSSAYSSLMEA